MKIAIYIFGFLLMFLISACVETGRNTDTEGSNILEMHATDMEIPQPVFCDTVYVPIYSEIYSQTKDTKFIEKYRVVIPPKAHLEKGFSSWLKRIIQISFNSGQKLTIYASANTHNFIKQKINANFDYNFELFDDFSDVLIISKDIVKNTMIIFNIARKNSISFEKTMEKTRSYIVKYFNHVNFMLVFPGSYSTLNPNLHLNETYRTENLMEV